MGPQVWQVVVGGAVVGDVALRQLDGVLTVHDVGLDDLRHIRVLRALLECRALADGATSIVLAGVGPAPVTALDALGAEGFETASVRMGLALGPGLPPEDQVRLAPMGPEARAAFDDRLAGPTADPLPDGPGHHRCTAWVGATVVGHLWLAVDPADPGPADPGPSAWVHHLEVVEEQRRRGHGAALLRATALLAREQGASTVGLDLPGDDAVARALCAGLGWTAGRTTYRRVVGR